MARFNHFLLNTLTATEGGLARLKGDTGGLTYKGIAENFNPNWPGWPAVKAVIAAYPDENDRQITGRLEHNSALQAQVVDFYRDMWYRIGADKLGDQLLANLWMDFFLHKPADSTLVMQQTLNQFFNAGLVPDGKLGRNTKGAMQKAIPQSRLYEKYRQARIDYYKASGGDNPRFWESWVNRVLWHFPAKKKSMLR